MEPTVILGLSINARMQGLAIISGNNLIDYHIQLRKEAWNPDKREMILASLQPWLGRYSIKQIALSIPYETQTSSQTKELLEAIASFCSEKKIRIASYPPNALYHFFEECKTKKEIMKTLAMKYPELLFHYHKEMRNKNKYYVKLFEAAGVATIHAQKLKGKHMNAISTGP
jgi:hypothetical protein